MFDSQVKKAYLFSTPNASFSKEIAQTSKISISYLTEKLPNML